MNKQALGRGLESLIPKTEKADENFLMLETTAIKPNPYQPRKDFDEEKLRELADSFTSNGIIQPLIVRRADNGFQLVAGERRLRAAGLAGIARVPAVLKDIGELDMLKYSLVENIQRDDLNPLEEASSYEKLANEFGISCESLADTLGKSRPAVANTLRILKLPPEVKDEIAAGRLSRGHAIALLGLSTPAEQISLAKKITAEGLSVRDTEKLVRKRTAGRTPPPKKEKTPEISAMEDRLRLMFGTRVIINTFRKGGKIEIEYYSEDDLGRILETLNIGAR